MWVRGLKHVDADMPFRLQQVAPHVGAWIETYYLAWYLSYCRVAPHVGAWIETCSDSKTMPSANGRTPCGCVD